MSFGCRWTALCILSVQIEFDHVAERREGNSVRNDQVEDIMSEKAREMIEIPQQFLKEGSQVGLNVFNCIITDEL